MNTFGVGARSVMLVVLLLSLSMISLPIIDAQQDSCGNLQTIAYGDTVTGKITNDSTAHFYCFMGEAGDEITVDMVATDGDLDALVVVSDLNVEEIFASNDNVNNSTTDAQIMYTLEETRAYLIGATRLDVNDGTTLGSYSISLISEDDGVATLSELFGSSDTGSDIELPESFRSSSTPLSLNYPTDWTITEADAAIGPIDVLSDDSAIFAKIWYYATPPDYDSLGDNAVDIAETSAEALTYDSVEVELGEVEARTIAGTNAGYTRFSSVEELASGDQVALERAIIAIQWADDQVAVMSIILLTGDWEDYEPQMIAVANSLQTSNLSSVELPESFRSSSTPLSLNYPTGWTITEADAAIGPIDVLSDDSAIFAKIWYYATPPDYDSLGDNAVDIAETSAEALTYDSVEVELGEVEARTIAGTNAGYTRFSSVEELASGDQVALERAIIAIQWADDQVAVMSIILLTGDWEDYGAQMIAVANSLQTK